MPMPNGPVPASGGQPQKGPGAQQANKSGMAGRMPGMGPGGSVMISGPEERALRVLELDPEDDAETYQRASQESGLPAEAIMQLAQRAESARQKGYSIKGPSITFPPHGNAQPDGLLGNGPGATGGPGGMPGASPLGGQPVTGTPQFGQAGGATPMQRPSTTGVIAGAKAPGGPVVGGATMSSAGLSGQRLAPPWRPQMSQATAAPSRMTPDVDTSGAPGAARSPMRPPMGGPGGAPMGARPPMGGTAPPPAAPVKKKGFIASNGRDQKLAAAYAREANVDAKECGCGCGGHGTCGDKAKKRRPTTSMWGG